MKSYLILYPAFLMLLLTFFLYIKIDWMQIRPINQGKLKVSILRHTMEKHLIILKLQDKH